jgi:hypothetical protein
VNTYFIEGTIVLIAQREMVTRTVRNRQGLAKITRLCYQLNVFFLTSWPTQVSRIIGVLRTQKSNSRNGAGMINRQNRNLTNPKCFCFRSCAVLPTWLSNTQPFSWYSIIARSSAIMVMSFLYAIIIAFIAKGAQQII